MRARSPSLDFNEPSRGGRATQPARRRRRNGSGSGDEAYDDDRGARVSDEGFDEELRRGRRAGGRRRGGRDRDRDSGGRRKARSDFSDDDLEWPSTRGGARGGVAGRESTRRRTPAREAKRYSEDDESPRGTRTRRGRGGHSDSDDGGASDTRRRGGRAASTRRTRRRGDDDGGRVDSDDGVPRGTWYEDEVVNRTRRGERRSGRATRWRGGGARRRWVDDAPEAFDDMLSGYETVASVAATRLVQRWAATESGVM